MGLRCEIAAPAGTARPASLDRLAADLTEITTVRVDLYGATSVLDVVTRLDAALAATGGTFGRAAGLEAASVQLTLRFARVAMARPARDRPDPTALLHNLLDVLIAAALSTPDAAHPRRVLRCPLGRHHHRDSAHRAAAPLPRHRAGARRLADIGDAHLVTDVAEPFFGQADLVEIGPCPQRRLCQHHRSVHRHRS